MEEVKPTITVEIRTPERCVFKGDVFSAVLPAVEGELEIRPFHTPYIARLEIGPLRLYPDMESKKYDVFSLNGGYLKLIKDQLIILTRSSEHAKEIDVHRAQS